MKGGVFVKLLSKIKMGAKMKKGFVILFVVGLCLCQGMSFADQFATDVPIRSEIISKKILPATKNTAKKLQLNLGDPIFFMRRLRIAYEQPIMVCDSRVPANKFPNIDTVDLIDNSLYKTLEGIYNCPVISSEREAVAEEAIDYEIINHLGVSPFSSILKLSGLSFTLGDIPVDIIETYLHPCVSINNKIIASNKE